MVRLFRLLHMMFPSQVTRPRTLLVFDCGKQKFVLRTSIYFNSMMGNMIRLYNSIPELNKSALSYIQEMLQQQYFLCSASLQGIIFRFKERQDGKDPRQQSEFCKRVAMHLSVAQ